MSIMVPGIRIDEKNGEFNCKETINKPSQWWRFKKAGDYNKFYIINKFDKYLTHNEFGKEEKIFTIQMWGNFVISIKSVYNSFLQMIRKNHCEFAFNQKSNFELWYLQEEW